MKHALTRVDQQREVERQVGRMLSASSSWQKLDPAERERIRRNTTAIVDTMVENKLRQSPGQRRADPFAVPMADPTLPPGFPSLPGQGGAGGATQPGSYTGGATTPGAKANFGPEKLGDFGSGIALGVAQTGQLLREVNFPAFVAELVQGVFQAVVDASIQQIRAYGELVQQVTMSLSDFRDQNVTPNQGRDHLASKFPSIMQVNFTDGGPKVGPRPGWDEQELPDFREELGVDADITDLDEETIEEVLVPAARDDLARQRQQLLMTTLLMGINRIVVTDGKINAKLKFDFRARDSMTTYAQQYDYENFGQVTVEQHQKEEGGTTGAEYKETSGWLGGSKSGESSRWSKGTDQITTAPVIYMTEQKDTMTEAEIAAEGQLRGDVTLNFKSETVDLNKLVSDSDMFKLQQAHSAGRGAPAPGQSAAAGGATTTPPATSTPPSSTTPAPAV
jgi:hypothetical protein